jgi:ribosome biogenesis GTPase A
MFQESGEQELLAEDSFHPGLTKRFSWIPLFYL